MFLIRQPNRKAFTKKSLTPQLSHPVNLKKKTEVDGVWIATLNLQNSEAIS